MVTNPLGVFVLGRLDPSVMAERTNANKRGNTKNWRIFTEGVMAIKLGLHGFIGTKTSWDNIPIKG